MRTFFRFFFNKDNILILAFTAVVAFIIQSINLNFDALNPVEKMFGDFDITDIYFHGIRAEKSIDESTKIEMSSIHADTNIVVVGFGNLPRIEVASLLEIIRKQEPKCIGIDAEYVAFAKDSISAPIDSFFAKTLKETPNVIIASNVSFKENTKQKIINKELDSPEFDTLLSPNPAFRDVAKIGFANLITEGTRDKVAREDLKDGTFMCRSFSPKAKLSGKEILFFAVEIAKAFDKKKVERFLARNNEVEFINYYGNYEKFTNIGYPQIFEMQSAIEQGDTSTKKVLKDIFKNKVVVIGFTGENAVLTTVSSEQDRFYTPLNKNYVGRSEKDMYGVYIHANIISMILREDYIDTMPDWANYLVTFIIAYIITALFVFLHAKLDFWYDGLSLLVQFLLSILVVFAILQVFDNFKMKVDWSLGFLAIVFIPNLVEVYYGAVTKLYERRQRLRRLKNKQVATLGVE